MSDWRETIYGNCPIHWDIKELIDISKLITDGSHFSPKPQAFGKMMCSVKDMRYNKFDFSDVKYINQNDYEKLVDQGCKPLLNDLLISKDGANCLDILFINKQREDFVLLSSIAIVRLQDTVFPEYIMYFLLSPQVQYILRTNFISGSAIPRVVLKDFKKVNILLPPLLEQRAIASVLSSLDDKIDLLHRQNKTLEAMAETLFRQWFVEEADEGWEEVALSSVINTTSGGTPSRDDMSFYQNGEIPWVKSKELNGTFIVETEENITTDALKKSAAKKLPVKSILIAMYGATVGEYGIIAKEMTCNQAICALIPNEQYPFTFLFHLVKSNKDELINMAIGSAQQNISQLLIKQMLVPTCIDKINRFHLFVEPFFVKIESNIFQIRTLEKLRDTLLPKLMSGEVRVDA